jgi:hypothetical protein
MKGIARRASALALAFALPVSAQQATPLPQLIQEAQANNSSIAAADHGARGPHGRPAKGGAARSDLYLSAVRRWQPQAVRRLHEQRFRVYRRRLLAGAPVSGKTAVAGGSCGLHGAGRGGRTPTTARVGGF